MIHKKFKEFNPVKKKWKSMNKLFIKGNLKGGFFKSKNEFELIVVFTGIKKIVIDIQLINDDLTLKDNRFDFDFKIGDHIDKVKKWVYKNKHTIFFEKNI